MTTTETTQEAPARWRTKTETVDAIQITEDNQKAIAEFCGIPYVPGLTMTVKALPGPGGIPFPCNLRPGDWIVKHAAGSPFEHFSVHGPAAFAAAYEPAAAGLPRASVTGYGPTADALRLECERDDARAELAKVRNGARTLGRTVVAMARTLEAARIEMLQNGPEAAMQWILNSIPDVDDNPPEQQWNGSESATEWLDRTEAYARETK